MLIQGKQMQINFNDSAFLKPGVSQTTRPTLSKATQQAIAEAKKNLMGIDAVPVHKTSSHSVTVDRPVEHFIDTINEKQQVAQDLTRQGLSGSTDNLHQSILAPQEAGLAFTLLIEMRNKLVEGFKELMRMSI